MSGPHLLRDFGLAVMQLTFVPLRFEWPRDARPRVSAWYPWVGLLLGLLFAVSVWLLGFASLPAVSALVGIAVLASATRLLHWDGLADVADAWFAPPERRLEIMRDSATGAFGTFAVAFVLLTSFVLLELVLSTPEGFQWELVAVPAFGRLAAMFGAWFGTPVRAEGLGAAVSGRPSFLDAVIAGLGTSVAVGLIVWSGYHALWVPGLLVVVALAIPHLISRRFGGVSGDVLGASVLVTEVFVLLVLALAPTLVPAVN